MAPAVLPSTSAALDWLRRIGAASLCTDSRHVRPGGVFVAWPGQASDGRRYVRDALAAGAAGCLVEADGAERFALADEPRIVALRGLKAATGEIASRFHDTPSQWLRMVATTGTNGKTSTTWWIAQALAALGRRCAVVGTLGAGEPPVDGVAAQGPLALQSTGLTTPDPVQLQALLRRFVDTGIGLCAIEASSIGLAEHRLGGTHIEVAVFTNLTQDHLDFHGTMDAYREAKARLFDWPGLKAAVLNIDDLEGARLAQALRGRGIDLWTGSARDDARLYAARIRYEGDGLCFEVRESGQPAAAVHTRLIGAFNVANLVAVIGALRALGVTLPDAARACAALHPVPGRMQRVITGAAATAGPEVVIDYAHTPDALEQALRSLLPFATQRGGRLWCVFGCGGNRDALKRPLMGTVASRLAARVVITSDNPRDERPMDIIAQIRAGAAGDVEVIEDRRAAIGWAIAQADARDVVLLAGKGHETTQEIAGRKLPFSDLEQAGIALQHRSAAA